MPPLGRLAYLLEQPDPTAPASASPGPRRLCRWSSVAEASLHSRQCTNEPPGHPPGAVMRAARVDANHAEIVRALRAMGCSVLSLAKVGDQAPDIAVGYRGRTYLLEIKDGSLPASKCKLRPGQRAWHEAWRGHVSLVTSWQEAVDLIQLLARDGL